MRYAQPSFGHRHRRSLLAGLQHVVAVGIDVAEGEKEIHVLGRARDPENRGDRAGDLDVLRERRRLERDPHAGRDAAAHHLRRGRRGRTHRAEAGGGIGARAVRSGIGRRRAAPALSDVPGARLRQIEIELGPARARERPFVLVAPFDLVAALADRELHRRLLHDAVVDAFEPVVEEPQLIAPPFLGVERDARACRRGCEASCAASRRA